MATVPLGTQFHHCCLLESPKFHISARKSKRSSLYYCRKGSFMVKNGAKSSKFRPSFDCRVLSTNVRASATSSISDTALLDAAVSDDVIYRETFPLQRIEKVEGKILIRLDSGKDEEHWQLTVGCNLPGKWVLHWGVNYENDLESEWDQPPVEMRPMGSITIKDYAIETPLTIAEADSVYEVKIDFNTKSSIAAINFVLKDEETGSWYQYRGRDFKVPLVDFSYDDGNSLGTKQGFSVYPGTSGQLSGMMLQSEKSLSEDESKSNNLKESIPQKRSLNSFYEEHSIIKENLFENSMNVYIKRGSDASNKLLHMETDLPGDVIVHWGVCKDESMKWEIPSEPFPANTSVFKNKALRTHLQVSKFPC